MRRIPAIWNLIMGLGLVFMAAGMWLTPGTYSLLFAVIDLFLAAFNLIIFTWELHKYRKLQPWGGIQA